ncbi:ketohexokinase-like [Haliotis rufescens]|uniref:ketohexokinase-like n=1 Tax=Haliotis rufescens TaxID=6454 RepID=UPI00201EE340|nr:ketohexokinase-like [Haliotis rufescens]
MDTSRVTQKKTRIKGEYYDRCTDYYWQRGGNASNSSTIISILGLPAEYLGVLADDNEGRWLRSDFERQGVNTDHCVTSDVGNCPVTSTITSEETGTRTIVFTERGLPELTFETFDKVDLSSDYKWIHFEGRPTTDELRKMFQKIKKHNESRDPLHRIKTSMEIEKVIFPELETLVSWPDYVFFSKEWSRSKGLTSKETSVDFYSKKVKPGGVAICAWGEDGAAGKTVDGDVISIKAFLQARVIDTLGCGDTFVGSVIAALSSGKVLRDAIQFGCQVAGAKCAIKGFTDLRQFGSMLKGSITGS